MTKNQLKAKTKEMLRSDLKEAYKLIDKAIVSGCMDIEGADNNYLLPKVLLNAIYKQHIWQRKPLHKDETKQIDNIYRFL